MGFPCHKVILSARSSVLKKMLDIGMREAVDDTVDLSDYGSDVVKTVLGYIYSGKAADIGDGDKSTDLLKAADYFDLPGLKKLCEVKIIPTLTVENAVDTIILARMYTANKLEEVAKKFIVGHSAQIMQQEGWRGKLGKPQFQDLL